MRFSFLVAVEIFFFSLICIGCDGCLSFKVIKSELTTFFLENDNKKMEYDDFKCRKDSPSGLLFNANININEEINPEYKILLCLEEFMYAFRSFFEDRTKGKADQQNLFDEFCRYVAQEIKPDNTDFDDKNSDAKRKEACDVLFLNLCKLFFIDEAKDVYGDVRYFGVIFKLLHNDQEHILKYLNAFISHVYQRLENYFVKGKLKIENFNAKDTPELLVIDDGEANYIEKNLPEIRVFPPKKLEKTKEIFYLENFSTSGKLMRKKIGEGYVVLIYDDFVVFKNKTPGEEIVWKRERKNRATPYSFYRKLSKNEIREIDIFAKDHEEAVIDILEGEIKKQMLYDFNILCSQITEFISCFEYKEEAFKSILEECVNYVKEKYPWKNTENFVKSNGGGDDIVKKIMSYFTLQEPRRGVYVVCLSEKCVKIFEKDYKLTEKLWFFLSLVAKGFYEGISNMFNEYKDDLQEEPWFKGLQNLSNSCYINALSQNLFDYEDEMQGMVNETFLKEMSQLQNGEIECFSDDFAKITGYDGTQQDSHDLFTKIFIPKKIIIKKSDAAKTSIKEGNKQRKGYNSFLFCFDSKFKCLEANAIKEGGEDEKLDFKDVFNEADKKEIKSIHDVLNFIYGYLNKYYCNLSLFHTTIDTYCDHNCGKKYNIKITISSGIAVDSYEVYNGLDLSSLIKKKAKEKLSGFCDYDHSKKAVDIYKEQVYHNFSDFLVVNLIRYNENEPLRNNISIPDNICFDDDRYDITGIVCHSGGLNSGHYIAYKKKFGLWFKFDDSKVSVVGSSLPDAAVKCAYMLFFKKNKEINDNKKTELKKDSGENKSKEKKENIKKKSWKEYESNKKEGKKVPEQEVDRKKGEQEKEERMRQQAEAETKRIQAEERRKEGERRKRKQEEERKKREERERNEKLARKREIFLSGLLQYYSIFNKRYFGNKNKDGETFVEYLQGIVKDIKDTNTLEILKQLNGNFEKRLYAFLLLDVREYCNLIKKIKEIGRDSNKLNEIHEEKPKLEKLEKLEKDIIMLICKDPTLCNFYSEMNTSSFLKEFVKVFFISFCDFDKTCEKPLFGKDTLQSLKKGDVEFFFNKDKNINIPENRDLPFFLITPIPIKDQNNDVEKNNYVEAGDTILARDEDDKYYCFWSDKLIIARDKKKQNDISQSNKHKNEINDECNKINIEDSKDINADYDSFENLALFKKTFEVAGCGFFEMADDERKNYLIPNIIEEVKKEREKKLNHLQNFIERIKNFIENFDSEIKKEIEECEKAINKKNKQFFEEKIRKIKAEYDLEIKDREETIAIAKKYKEELKGELKGFEKDIVQIDDGIKKVKEQIDEKKKDINKKQLAAGAQYNNLIKSKSKTQVSEGKNNVSTQLGADKNQLKELEKKLDVLSRKKKSTENSMYQVNALVDRVEGFIESREKERRELEDVLKKAKINFGQYEKRLASYSPYYKGGWNKEGGENEDVLTVLRKLREDINAVLKREEKYIIQSFNINFKDIINPFNSYSFDLFVSMIEEKISDSIISSYLINDLYEYLFFGKKTCKKLLVGSGQRFKGVQNLRNTCYINSILQNLVEFKDDLLRIKDLRKDEKSSTTANTIHDTVFKVLGEKGSDPRIGLHNVLNISITNGLGKTGDPAEVYTSLMNYYINNLYKIEVVDGSGGGDFVYEPLKGKDLSSCNAKFILPSVKEEYKEITDTDIINHLYKNKEFEKSIKEYNLVSQGPFVFHNIVKRKNCASCGKGEITIEIECLPFCMINQNVDVVNKISDVVKGSFDTVNEEDEKSDTECDYCKEKLAKLKRSSCYRAMNNCLCFQFVYNGAYAKNVIDIEDEVKVGDDEYELVCACYYTPGHYIAFKKINDTWFEFNDATVSPIIYKSLPRMYKGYKPTLVFYKKKIKDKK